MIRCQDCEFFHRDAAGRISFSCDPFSTIKEPECLNKWQLIKLDQLVQAYGASVEFTRRFAPLQEKMFKMMERELDDADESERWKQEDAEGEEPESEDPPQGWTQP
jgi:hypothetical protein